MDAFLDHYRRQGRLADLLNPIDEPRSVVHNAKELLPLRMRLDFTRRRIRRYEQEARSLTELINDMKRLQQERDEALRRSA